MPFLAHRFLLIASALFARGDGAREPVRYRLDILSISSSIGAEGSRGDTLFTTITLSVTLSDSGNARFADILIEDVWHRRTVGFPSELDSSATGVTARLLIVSGRSARMLGTFIAPPGRKTASLSELTFALRELFPVFPLSWRQGQPGVALPVNTGAYILTSWRVGAEHQGLMDLTSSDSMSFNASDMDDQSTAQGTNVTFRDVTTSREGPIVRGTVRRIFRSEAEIPSEKIRRSARKVVTTVIARVP